MQRPYPLQESPAPITLQEALTCFCGHGLERHTRRNFPYADGASALYCHDCECLCVRGELRERIRRKLEARTSRRPGRTKWERYSRSTYRRRREEGWCSLCARGQHAYCTGLRCRDWPRDRTYIECLCGCREEDGGDP